MAQWLGRMNPYHLRVTIVTIRNVDWLWFLGAPILMPMTWSRYSKERLGARDVEQVCRIVCKAAVATCGLLRGTGGCHGPDKNPCAGDICHI
jgi:hypothetical protein